MFHHISYFYHHAAVCRAPCFVRCSEKLLGCGLGFKPASLCEESVCSPLHSLNTCRLAHSASLNCPVGVKMSANGCPSLCVSTVTDSLSRLFPASGPVSAGIVSSPLQTLMRVSAYGRWMNVYTVLNSIVVKRFQFGQQMSLFTFVSSCRGRRQD